MLREAEGPEYGQNIAVQDPMQPEQILKAALLWAEGLGLHASLLFGDPVLSLFLAHRISLTDY